MHRLSSFFVPPSKTIALAFALVAAVPVWAQEAVFTADTRLVVLHASVVDKSGKLITNLPRTAFRVYEDGIEQTLKVFRREDVPVSMGLVIDNSGSMRDKRLKVESSAMALVKASNPQDEVFIVNFNDDAFLDVEFTGDIKKMEEGLARLDSRGGTAMRDAISLSIDHMKEKAKKDKKVILVVTDGNDNTSEITLERLVQKAQQAEVLIYAVALLNEEDKREARKARRDLTVITEATGGQVYFPKELDEVGKISLQVAHDIRNQYILAYTPANQAVEKESTFHEIKVTVNAPNRPVVRTRRGYYSKRPAASQAGSASSSQAALK